VIGARAGRRGPVARGALVKGAGRRTREVDGRRAAVGAESAVGAYGSATAGVGRGVQRS